MFSIKALLATVLLTSITSALPISESSVESRDVFIKCDTGIRIFPVRPSNTEPGNNAVFFLGKDLANSIADSVAHGIPYPASMDNYPLSESTGVNELTFRVKRYVDHCPNSKIALIGYSQGAQVVGDTLIGYSGTTGQGLPEQYRSNIAAVILMGDPAFVPGQSFNQGTAYTQGTGARTNSDQYTSYGFADKMQSYCDADDRWCASGGSDAVHNTYLDRYRSAAWDFVVARAY